MFTYCAVHWKSQFSQLVFSHRFAVNHICTHIYRSFLQFSVVGSHPRRCFSIFRLVFRIPVNSNIGHFFEIYSLYANAKRTFSKSLSASLPNNCSWPIVWYIPDLSLLWSFADSNSWFRSKNHPRRPRRSRKKSPNKTQTVANDISYLFITKLYVILNMSCFSCYVYIRMCCCVCILLGHQGHSDRYTQKKAGKISEASSETFQQQQKSCQAITKQCVTWYQLRIVT